MTLSPEDRRIYDWVVKDVLRECGLSVPPYDLERITGRFGVTVYEDWDDDARASLHYAREPKNPLHLSGRQAREGVFIFDQLGHREIRLSPNLSRMQRNLVLAHEVAHAILGHDAFQMKNPGYAPESYLEETAQYVAHQLLTGVDTFARVVEEAAQGELPSKWLILHLRKIFELKTYVALRSYVEHARRPAAIVSLIVRDDNRVRVVGYCSASWIGAANFEPPVTLAIDDPLAIRALQLVHDPRSNLRAIDVVDHGQRRYAASHIELEVSDHSAHLLMHRTNS